MNRLAKYMIGFYQRRALAILSKKLGVKENDTDAMIVKQEKKSIAEIFADEEKNISEKQKQAL